MTEFQQDLVLVLAGAIAAAILGGIGFLLKRLFKSADPVDKFIERHERLLKAHTQENPHALPASDKQQLDEHVQKLPFGPLPLGPETVDTDVTQAQMNMTATADANAREQEMRQVFNRLLQKLGRADAAALAASQKSWEAYARLQASLAAAPFSGGSIMPAVYHAERSALYASRAAELTRLFDDLSM